MFEKYRQAILQSDLLLVEGKVQRQDKVMHIVVTACYDISKMLAGLSKSGAKAYYGDPRHEEPAKKKAFPGSRDFK